MRDDQRPGAARPPVAATGRRRATAVLAMAVLGAVCACGVPALQAGSGVPATQAGSGGPATIGSGRAGTRQPFPDLFRRTGSATFDRAPSRRALADESTVVVLGRLTDIRAGRTVGSTRSDVVEHRLVHLFTVERVVKGDGVGPRIQVETDWPGDPPIEDYGASVPGSGRAVLYLRPAATGSRDLIFTADRLPLGPGAPLFVPTTPQGYVIDVDGGLCTPLLLGNRPQPVFPDEADPRELDRFLPPA
jgi:hypothetical protein